MSKKDYNGHGLLSSYIQILANLATVVAIIFAAIEISENSAERKLNSQLRAIEMITPRLSSRIIPISSASYINEIGFNILVDNRSDFATNVTLKGEIKLCQDGSWDYGYGEFQTYVEPLSSSKEDKFIKRPTEDIAFLPGRSFLNVAIYDDARDPMPIDNHEVAISIKFQDITLESEIVELVRNIFLDSDREKAALLANLQKSFEPIILNREYGKPKCPNHPFPSLDS